MKTKTPKLNSFNLISSIVLVLLLTSCSNSIQDQPATAEGFKAIENELKNKFGEDAYYTDLTITHNTLTGNIIGVIVTDNPESFKMGQWNLTQDNWQHNSEISIEVPEGTKAADYMFQLGKVVNLPQLGGLVEQSIEKLNNEKQIENPTLSVAGINFPDDGDVSKAKYMINLQPENGGTTFNFLYALDGNLIEMDY